MRSLYLNLTKERIKDYNRITIGTREEMELLIAEIKKIVEEKRK